MRGVLAGGVVVSVVPVWGQDREGDEPTYKLVAADKVVITVKFDRDEVRLRTVSKTSVATGKVAAGSLTSVKPRITGTVKVGKKLTAKPGTWKPSGA